jgi:hypothetical protein
MIIGISKIGTVRVSNLKAKIECSCLYFYAQEFPQVATNGLGRHVFLADLFSKHDLTSKENVCISVLAKSASILFTATKNSFIGTPGLLFQLDYINETSGSKEFRILECKELKSSNNEDCIPVYTKRVSNIIKSSGSTS